MPREVTHFALHCPRKVELRICPASMLERLQRVVKVLTAAESATMVCTCEPGLARWRPLTAHVLMRCSARPRFS